MAEAHPVGFQWVVEAKARGATVIHVDPRFTRTSALADTYVPIRAGSDIAFLGGIVDYILSNELDFREYLLAYTNAATIVTGDFRDTENLDGLFSGFDPETRGYDITSWQYQGHEPDSARHDTAMQRATASGLQHESHGPGVGATTERDETLQHPRCVYQLLKRHFTRYTPEVVEATCGVPPERFEEVCRACGPTTPAGNAPPRWSTRWAGHSTRSASSTSAPARSFNCCLATWAARAAVSWRCGGTPTSRARPTSPRCSTCCPATCRCPTTPRSRRLLSATVWIARPAAVASP